MTLGVAGEVVFDSLYRAHLSVVSDSPSRTAANIFNQLQTGEGLGTMVLKVEPNDMPVFVQELSEEVKIRKSVLQKYNFTRVYDFQSSGESVPNTLKRVYVILLLPRTISNMNLKMLDEILCKTVPLDIHFIVVTPADVNRAIKEKVECNSYWLYDEDEGELQHR